MPEEDEIPHILDLELSDKEVFYIGKIVSQWGAIEHAVFIQTLLTFDNDGDEEIQLPKAMNNLRFSDVLELWKELVIDELDGEQQEKLLEQYEKIHQLKVQRNALVHGMWEWNPKEPDVITTTRIRKKEIISTKFKSDDLVDFYTQLGKIHFAIRFPGGVEELIEEQMDQGGYISRRAFGMFSGDGDSDE